MDLNQIIKERNRFYNRIFIIPTIVLIFINFIVLFITKNFYSINSLFKGNSPLTIFYLPTLVVSLFVFFVIFIFYITRAISINYQLSKLKNNNEIDNINKELNETIKNYPIHNIICTKNFIIIYNYHLHIIKYDNIKYAYLINKNIYHRYGGIRNSSATKIILNNNKQFEFETTEMLEELKNRCTNNTEFKVPNFEKKIWNFYIWFIIIIFIILAIFLLQK